jgi:hypothetical protein
MILYPQYKSNNNVVVVSEGYGISYRYPGFIERNNIMIDLLLYFVSSVLLVITGILFALNYEYKKALRRSEKNR